MGISPYYDYELGGLNPRFKLVNFVNGSNTDLAVNGSSTNQTFTAATPDAVNIWYVVKLVMFIYDPGSNDYDDFGAISLSGGHLTNGLQLFQRNSSTDWEIDNFRNNADLAMFFRINHNPSASGFLDDQEATIGTKFFEPTIQLNGASGDLMKVVVRDNLNSLEALRFSMLVYKAV